VAWGSAPVSTVSLSPFHFKRILPPGARGQKTKLHLILVSESEDVFVRSFAEYGFANVLAMIGLCLTRPESLHKSSLASVSRVQA
jgi:hypothetical protein